MKERPILFSAPMVRAILEGRKTQTRRVIKPQPSPGAAIWGSESEPQLGQYAFWANGDASFVNCPYGKPGDRLWVREPYFQLGHWEEVPGIKTKTGRMKWRFVADSGDILFDAPEDYRKGRHHQDPYTPAWHKRLGRFMPRKHARIMLEVTDIRVERLQVISEENAIAEGIEQAENTIYWRNYDPSPGGDWRYWESPILSFRSLWTSINGADGWESNPWVWIVSFKRIQP